MLHSFKQSHGSLTYNVVERSFTVLNVQHIFQWWRRCSHNNWPVATCHSNLLVSQSKIDMGHTRCVDRHFLWYIWSCYLYILRIQIVNAPQNYSVILTVNTKIGLSRVFQLRKKHVLAFSLRISFQLVKSDEMGDAMTLLVSCLLCPHATKTKNCWFKNTLLMCLIKYIQWSCIWNVAIWWILWFKASVF